MGRTVFIHDLTKEPVESYVAECQDDCKDEIDATVYRLVSQFDEPVTMGKVIGEPA